MKKLVFLLVNLLFVVLITYAQTPQAMKYQAVARNSAGDPVPNQSISVRISILTGTAGPTIYSELHNLSTNDFGLFNLEIGNPTTVLSGIFAAISWGMNDHYLKVEIDITGGTNYLDMGTSPILSVPYALWSENTANPEDADADPGNELQILSIVGTDLTLSDGGGTVPLPNGLWNLDGPNLYYDAGAVGIGGIPWDPEAMLQVQLPNSGNFARVRIDSPADDIGFGLSFAQPAQEWWIGQNIGNYDDGRFQIAPFGSFHWFTMLSNGNIGLTKPGFSTPFARLQVPENSNMDTGSGLDLNGAAIFTGHTMNDGIALDQDQIECVGESLKVNYLSGTNVLIANGGGTVGVRVEDAKAPFHVGEGSTILFGADTNGKTNFYPDAKLMFKPGKGGAFRVGQLNADGSLTNGTGWNYWDDSNVGWASVAIGNNTKAKGAGSVAIGIRSLATNFGSVALGHLSRTIGNSAVAAGYYTRADAFVGCAVGAGNVGGGSANGWNATDPIFEVGNSIDTNNRSNAFTVLKNGRVGINHHNPQSMVDIEQPNSGPGNGVLMNLASVGHWETGVDNAADYNFYWNNALKAYILDTDGTYINTSDRALKENIRPLEPVLDRVLQLSPSTYRFKDADPSADYSTGFIAQEVIDLFPTLVVEKNDILALKYSEFGVLAIKAIQEQQEVIDLQQQQISDLEKRLNALERRLSR